MANYADYSDVEQHYFLTTGKTFTSEQRTVITNIITQVHGVIVSYLGSEPASTDNLVYVETQMALRAIWNAEHPEKEPIPLLTDELKEMLDREKEGQEDDILMYIDSWYES